MEDPIRKVEKFITTENCFAVMGELRRLGVLSKDDVHRAMGMNRRDWISFMKEKAEITGPDIKAEGAKNVE